MSNIVPLRDLIEIKNGKDYKHLAKGSVPVYGTGGVMTYVDSFLYDGESVLLPRKGTLDNICYVNGKFWTVDTMYWTIVDSQKVYPKYLFCYLSLLDLSCRDSGSTLPSMTFDAYYTLPIKLFDYDTQVKIGDTYFKLTEKTENNNTINAELEAMAKTIYDYWFLQFEFPDENGKPYKSSGGKMVWNEKLNREIPDGWSVNNFSELCTLNNGINYDKNEQGDKKYKIVNVRNITASSFILDNSDFDEIVLKSSQADKFIVGFNDILIARSGTPGAVRLLLDSDENTIFCGFIIKCLPNEAKHRLFLTYYLKQFEGSSATKTGGSILQNVSQDTLNQLIVCVPPISIVEQFNDKIIPILDKVQQCIDENQELASLRDFLLPLLMNGQVTFKTE